MLSHKFDCPYPGQLALSSELSLLVVLPLITNDKVRPLFWTTPTEKAERISQPTININELPGLQWDDEGENFFEYSEENLARFEFAFLQEWLVIYDNLRL